MNKVRWNVEHLDHVDSTNTWLAQRAREGAGEGLVLYSDFQSAGRGRLDREWRAASGSALLCSALLSAPSDALTWTVVAAALSISDALDELTELRPSLKWPNDVLYGDLKVAGLLADVVASDPPRVVVGLGLNLTGVDPSFTSATTVLDATGERLEPTQVLKVYLEALSRRRELLESREGLQALRLDYLAALSTVGQRVCVQLPGASVRGLAVGVDDAGALRVQVGSEVRVFTAGDVVHLRREEEE